MPTTLTLKNIPDDIYERLKETAMLHRRSLNSEAILCLEYALTPARIAPAERLARAKALRDQVQVRKVSAWNIDADKRKGRA